MPPPLENKAFQVVIVDDDPVSSAVIKKTLEKNKLLEVAWQCFSGEEFLQQVSKHRLHLVVLDFSMPGINGMQVMEEVNRLGINTPVISFSQHTFPNFVDALYAHGVKRCLRKPDLRVLEAMALTVLNRGHEKTFLSQHTLSAFEIELLFLLSENYTLSWIANLMRNLTAEAVKKRKAHLAAKLEIENNNLEFFRWAVAHEYLLRV